MRLPVDAYEFNLFFVRSSYTLIPFVYLLRCRSTNKSNKLIYCISHNTPSTFHIGFIFPLCFSGAINAAHQLGVSGLNVCGPFSLAHQPAPDKNRPDVHLIPLSTVRSEAVRGKNIRRFAQVQKRALGHFRAAYTFGVSRHGAMT